MDRRTGPLPSFIYGVYYQVTQALAVLAAAETAAVCNSPPHLPIASSIKACRRHREVVAPKCNPNDGPGVFPFLRSTTATVGPFQRQQTCEQRENPGSPGTWPRRPLPNRRRHRFRDRALKTAGRGAGPQALSSTQTHKVAECRCEGLLCRKVPSLF